MMCDTSEKQLAFLFSTTGFFQKLRIAYKNLSAIDGPLTVTLGCSCIFLSLKEFLKSKLYTAAPRSLPILLGFLFELAKIFENSFVFVRGFLYFKGLHYVYLLELSNMMNVYLHLSIFEIL